MLTKENQRAQDEESLAHLSKEIIRNIKVSKCMGNDPPSYLM